MKIRMVYWIYLSICNQKTTGQPQISSWSDSLELLGYGKKRKRPLSCPVFLRSLQAETWCWSLWTRIYCIQYIVVVVVVILEPLLRYGCPNCVRVSLCSWKLDCKVAPRTVQRLVLVMGQRSCKYKAHQCTLTDFPISVAWNRQINFQSLENPGIHRYIYRIAGPVFGHSILESGMQQAVLAKLYRCRTDVLCSWLF